MHHGNHPAPPQLPATPAARGASPQKTKTNILPFGHTIVPFMSLNPRTWLAGLPGSTRRCRCQPCAAHAPCMPIGSHAGRAMSAPPTLIFEIIFTRPRRPQHCIAHGRQALLLHDPPTRKARWVDRSDAEQARSVAATHSHCAHAPPSPPPRRRHTQLTVWTPRLSRQSTQLEHMKIFVARHV